MTTPTDLLIQPREQSLMGLPIRRLLPWRHQRHCGPFVFLDHMGPHTLGEAEGLDVPPHPHIGLATLTWLLAGELEHRDSLGSAQRIRRGEVNWMTAGHGIVHSERSPADQRQSEAIIEGLQFWVAQPQDTETAAPRFEHRRAEELPRWRELGADWTLVIGDWAGQRSPVRADSPLALLDVRADAPGQLDMPRPSADWEWGLYSLGGALDCQGEPLPSGHLRITNQPARIGWAGGSHFVLFGGEPLGERRMDWNFVASRPELIDRARDDWRNHAFPAVPGDDGYVPYPGD